MVPLLSESGLMKLGSFYSKYKKKTKICTLALLRTSLETTMPVVT